MSTLGDLYRTARSMAEQRVGESMKTKQPDQTLMREVSELKRIMALLISAFRAAGGSKAD